MTIKSLAIKEILIKEIENYFEKDKKRINHAKKVMVYAKEFKRVTNKGKSRLVNSNTGKYFA